MTARWITADVFDGLATLDDASVDLVVTSPPFLALRSYLPADHPDKAKEIGSEPTPAAFIDVLLAVTAELRRVLAPHGSICVELGDTYAGSGGAGGDYGEDGLREGQPKFRQGTPRWDGRPEGQVRTTTSDPTTVSNSGGPGWPLAKSKTLIPELYRLALAYGINPLTGQESPAGRWRVRNNVTWCRPNPPVGALGDKWRPATSDIVIACTSDKRYWDDIATRLPSDYDRPNLRGNGARASEVPGQRKNMSDHTVNAAGAPLLDWQSPLADAIDRAASEAFAVGRHTTEPLFGETKTEVKETIGRRTLRELAEQGAIDAGDVLYLPPGGYPGSHYAVYPPALIEPLIKAMAPPKICRTCGEPSRRIVETKGVGERTKGASTGNGSRGAGGDSIGGPNAIRHQSVTASSLGWSCCGCCGTSEWDEGPNGRFLNRENCADDHWRPAHILDPFAGSGTTLAVATGHGHEATGIDLDERNRDLAYERIGPFLFSE